MEILEFIAGIRTPSLDQFFLLITKLGEELFLILIALYVAWCKDKKNGYYLFIVGFCGLMVNQIIKFIARVPRPWIKNPELSVVEGAKAKATGYSFPSGHTQTSVGLYGCLARFTDNKILKIFCFIIIILVPFSRLYLGVHTPIDVLTSFVLAGLMVTFIYPVVNKSFDSIKRMSIIFGSLLLVGIIYVIYLSQVQNTETDKLIDALENGYKMIGAIAGLWLSFTIDKKYVNYETNAIWWAQIIKLVGGMIIFVLLRTALKSLFSFILGTNLIEGAVRYFILVFIGLCVWPMTFKFYPKK